MVDMFTQAFWMDALERAIATFAQTLLALAGTAMLDWVSLDWVQIAIASLIAAGLSVAKSLAASYVGSEPNASVVPYKYDSEA